MTGRARVGGHDQGFRAGQISGISLPGRSLRACAVSAGVLQLVGWRQERQCYSKSGPTYEQLARAVLLLMTPRACLA